MTYKFKGYDWEELAKCWGIKVKKRPLNVKAHSEDSEFANMFKVKETIEIEKEINGMKVVFTVDDKKEVLAEKIKRHIWDSLDWETGSFKDENVRKDMDNFLKALIKESEMYDYNTPIIKGLLNIKHDETFAVWFCRNLEKLWS